MKLTELLQDVAEQKEKRNLILDFDSIIFLSAYKYRETDNEELVYMDCCKRIYSIERECWEHYELGETRLALTSNTNFRYDIYPEYKENRKEKDESAEMLSQLVKRAKRLIYDRLKPILEVSSKVEADDICIMFATKHNYIVGAIDSDVINQCPTPVFNFHSKHWKFVHQGEDAIEINKAILVDSIKGKSKDNI